jgi:hypothetical protein
VVSFSFSSRQSDQFSRRRIFIAPRQLRHDYPMAPNVASGRNLMQAGKQQPFSSADEREAEPYF